MNNRPLVSIVLPFYNAESTLGNSIQSIVNQSYKNFELLLIDNNSTDGSREVAEKQADNDVRIRLLTETKQGVVFAANKGLQCASGKYIARMDSDDISYPNRIHDQVQFLELYKDIDLVSGQVKYTGDESNGGFISYVDWLNGITTPQSIYINQFVEYPIVNSSIMMRRMLYDKYGGYLEGAFPEDYEYFLRLMEKGVKMQKVESVVLSWTDSPGRLTRNDPRYSRDAFNKIKAGYLARWLKQNNLHYPDVWIWGGKQSRRWSRYLRNEGINIIGYIDVIDSKRKDMVNYKQVDKYMDSFILSYVSGRGARDEIRIYLNTIGLKEVRNYLICG
ncbi:MAG: glycosyltransferase [Cyclobacteriaceae bacterium]